VFFLLFPFKEKFPGPTKDVAKVTPVRSLNKKGAIPWKNDVQELKQCWSKPEFGQYYSI